MTRIQPTTDDADPTLTLDVEDRPRIAEGDTLLVTPDVGTPYRCTVAEIDGDRVAVRIPQDRQAPRPDSSSFRRFDRDELEAFYVRCALAINPPERPPVS